MKQLWEACIRRMADGDLKALETLYDETSPVIFGIVLRILRDRQSAEDTLLDIYRHAFAEASRFDARRSCALDWLIVITRDFALRRRREANAPRQTFLQPPSELLTHTRSHS